MEVGWDDDHGIIEYSLSFSSVPTYTFQMHFELGVLWDPRQVLDWLQDASS